MRTKLKNLDVSEIHVDLDDVSLIEMRGQKESVAGWVRVLFSMRNGRQVDIKMQVIDYEEVLLLWNPPEATP